MSFPRAVEEFRDDPRCALEDGAWILTDFDDEDKMYKWSESSNTWQPLGNNEYDEEFKADMASMGINVDKGKNDLKRKADDDKPEPAPKKAAKQKMPKKEFVNTSIYITGLPLDATFTEVHDFFKKFGLIQENIDSETPRIKMYTDENGTFKGEALVTYFRPESVTQAINLADESDFRGFGSGNMRITEADSSYKKVKEYEAVDGGDTKKVQKRRKDVEKIKRATEKMNAKLADWSDDDEYEKPAEKGKPNKFANSVIVRNMFTGDILEEEKEAREQAIANGETPEPSILIDIVDDIKDMAKEQQWGNIKTIDVFDLEPDGVIIITFTNPVDAEKGLRNLDGRFYDQRQLSAEIQTKRARFRKTKEDESDEERRLQQYGEELTKGLA